MKSFVECKGIENNFDAFEENQSVETVPTPNCTPLLVAEIQINTRLSTAFKFALRLLSCFFFIF